MKSMMLAALVAATAVTGLAAPARAATNLLENGSFETGDFTGWTRSGNFGFTNVINAPGFCQHGDFCVSAGPVGSEGVLSQSFFAPVGGQLSVTGWLAGNGTAPSSFSVALNGVAGAAFNPVPSQGFTQFSFSGVSIGVNTFQIAFRNDPSFNQFDNFSVTSALPEPAAWALMIAGFGLVGAAARRRARRIASEIPADATPPPAGAGLA
jgi:PEP-CTERM motif